MKKAKLIECSQGQRLKDLLRLMLAVAGLVCLALSAYPAGVKSSQKNGTSLELYSPDQSIRPLANKANGKIAFASRSIGQSGHLFEIFTMNADGTDQRQLTNTLDSDNYLPAWSPDGTKIAFTRLTYTGLHTKSAIYVMNSDGSNQKVLTNNGYDETPAWSPDGTQIVFAGGTGILDIYVISADGTNQRRLTDPAECCGKFSPNWSHDGTRILFATQQNNTMFQGSAIYVMNADGTNRTRLVGSDLYYDSPTWSPDDRKILFTFGDDFGNGIVAMNADGSNQTPLPIQYDNYQHQDYDPSWSPDGTKIVFWGYPAEANDHPRIYVANADGSQTRKLTSNSISDDVTPAWQPLTALTVNPIDDPGFFVRQQYRDFLGREPDPAGLAFWTNEITSCSGDSQCVEAKRINVSAAYFLSIELQQTGYLVYRFYKTSYGNLPGAPVPLRLNEFLPDTQKIGQGVIVNQAGWETVLENNKQAFTTEFVQRPRFVSTYPTSMSAEQFVDALFANAGVTPLVTDRTAAINEFAFGATTADDAARARALRRVAENSTLAQQEFNRAFVLMEYFGYLRRNPNDAPDVDFSGYDFWLNKLNQFDGNYLDAEMVKAFIKSTEYRQRFGP